MSRVFPGVSSQLTCNTSPGRHPGGIWTRCLILLSLLISAWKSSGYIRSPSWITELHITICLRDIHADTLWRKLISAACIGIYLHTFHTLFTLTWHINKQNKNLWFNIQTIPLHNIWHVSLFYYKAYCISTNFRKAEPIMMLMHGYLVVKVV